MNHWITIIPFSEFSNIPLGSTTNQQFMFWNSFHLRGRLEMLPGDMPPGVNPSKPRPDQRIIERLSCYRNDSRDKDAVLTIIAVCLACLFVGRCRWFGGLWRWFDSLFFGLPSTKRTYPTLGKGKIIFESTFGRGYVHSLKGNSYFWMYWLRQ